MDLLNILLENAARSIFRFEGLQDYSAEDGDEMVRVFEKTGVPLRHPQDSSWWQEVKRKNEKGVKTCRVRMVTEPPTPYTKMELAYLREAAQFSGDEVKVIGAPAFEKALGDCQDFWLFDDRVVFTMWYGPKGKFLGGEVVPNKQQVERFVNTKRILIENSKPL